MNAKTHMAFVVHRVLGENMILKRAWSESDHGGLCRGFFAKWNEKRVQCPQELLVGSGVYEIWLGTNFWYLLLAVAGLNRQKWKGFHSEKKTYTGLCPHNGDQWQFWRRYQTNPILGRPWKTHWPTFVFVLWPIMPSFGPKNGPKRPKTAQIAILLLY